MTATLQAIDLPARPTDLLELPDETFDVPADEMTDEQFAAYDAFQSQQEADWLANLSPEELEELERYGNRFEAIYDDVHGED